MRQEGVSLVIANKTIKNGGLSRLRDEAEADGAEVQFPHCEEEQHQHNPEGVDLTPVGLRCECVGGFAHTSGQRPHKETGAAQQTRRTGVRMLSLPLSGCSPPRFRAFSSELLNRARTRKAPPSTQHPMAIFTTWRRWVHGRVHG